MAPTLCGGAISSRRGLLASLWSLVIILTLVAFLAALVFAQSSGTANANSYYNDDNNNGGRENQQNEKDAQIAVTSRALAFSALWTAVLAALMAVFGTVILGWQSPTGLYYTCCSSSVHRTTPLGLGSFIGALLMFANLTLVCSVLFGEFEVRVRSSVNFACRSLIL
jgi:small-conductance mechanosensitive channel